MHRPDSRRVLIVEDELDVICTLEAWLEAGGWEVRSARSGRAALDMASSFQPHVVITDYMLQGEVSGVDIIEQIKARGLKARCVLITGVLQNALLESVRRLHGVPILTKPFDFRRLSELLNGSC